MLADLTRYIQSLQKQQHQIFLMWDANSTLTDPNIKTFMATCHLYDLQHGCISAIPINTSARGHHINFLFVKVRKEGAMITKRAVIEV